MLGYLEKLAVGVMPRMAGLVMGRRGQLTVGLALLPRSLAFQPGTVAGGTMFRIDRFAQTDLFGIVGARTPV